MGVAVVITDRERKECHYLSSMCRPPQDNGSQAEVYYGNVNQGGQPACTITTVTHSIPPTFSDLPSYCQGYGYHSYQHIDDSSACLSPGFCLSSPDYTSLHCYNDRLTGRRGDSSLRCDRLANTKPPEDNTFYLLQFRNIHYFTLL